MIRPKPPHKRLSFEERKSLAIANGNHSYQRRQDAVAEKKLKAELMDFREACWLASRPTIGMSFLPLFMLTHGKCKRRGKGYTKKRRIHQ